MTDDQGLGDFGHACHGALAFLDEQLDAGRPFFACVATNAPHDPDHDVPEDLAAHHPERVAGGVWRLEAREPLTVELSRVFPEETTLDDVAALVDGEPTTLAPVSASDRDVVGVVRLPPRRISLELVCAHGGEPVAPSQVELRRR